jgi:DNA gyrase/topoisomerase IV subunit B
MDFEFPKDLSDAVRRRPAMYFGLQGARALPAMILNGIHAALTDVSKSYQGPITVQVGNRESSINFEGLNNQFFGPAKFGRWINVDRLKTGLKPGVKWDWADFSTSQKRGFLQRSQRSEFSFLAAAADYMEISEFDGKDRKKLRVNPKAARKFLSDRLDSGARYTRISFAPNRRAFGMPGHDELYLIAGGLRDLSVLRPGLATEIRSTHKELVNLRYCFERGLESLLFEEEHTRWPIYAGVLRASAKQGLWKFECVIRFLHAGVPRVRSWVNYHPTQGGAHLEAIGQALSDLFSGPSAGCRTAELIVNPDTGAKVLLPRTFVGALHLQCDAPRFMGPTKDVLMGEEIREFIYRAAKSQFAAQWEKLKDQRAF